MPIFHLHVGIVSRKTGRSAVAASAYRAGVKLRNERDGLTHDYTRKSGVVYSEIMLPENAPRKFGDRYFLWNAVERIERRWDAQTAREIDIALPVEFSRQEQIEVVRKYINENFTSQGMCADFVVHDKGDGNPHAHIMLTTRHVTESGFGSKNRDWNKTELLEQWRKSWATVCNELFKEKGMAERIDHRTLEAQGIDREPTIHYGLSEERKRQNEAIIKRNEARSPAATAEYMHELKQVYVILDNEITVLKEQVDDMRHEIYVLKRKEDEIIERADHIKTIDERLSELKTQRQDMGLFKSKKAIDEQIGRLERSHEQATSYFKQNYGIAPNEVAAEVKRLKYEAKDMERKQERLRGTIEPLAEDRMAIANEYKRQKLLSSISPDRQDIQEKLAQLDKTALAQMQSSQDRIAWIQRERIIDRVTQRNFDEILKDVRPEQAEALIEHRVRIKEREVVRGFTHELF